MNPGKKRLLFVCECNLNRSPTFEKLAKRLGYEAKSAGSGYCGYDGQPVTKELLDWADMICAMEREQKEAIIKKWGTPYAEKTTVLGVPDIYDADSPLLVKIAEKWFKAAEQDGLFAKCMMVRGKACGSDYGRGVACDGMHVPDGCPWKGGRAT